MARAVIEIGAERTSLLVANPEAGRLTPLLERRQELVAARLGARALVTVIESEAEIARRAGATSLQILIAPELRGSHLCRGLERRLRAGGLGRPLTPTAAERGRLTFRGATATADLPAGGGDSGDRRGDSGDKRSGDARSDSVAVVEIGPAATSIAVGRRGSRPSWWASRPLNGRRLGNAALRADPPRETDQEVALELARGQLATLKPPGCDQALLAGPAAGLLTLLCGETVDATACRRARGRLSDQLSEIVAARLDIAPHQARSLPALLTIAQAAGELLGRPLRIVHGGPAEGLLLLRQEEEIGSREPA